MHIHVLTYTSNHHSFHTCAYCIFSISLVPRDFHTVVENLHDNVDRSALLYLVNKQALTGRLARWMLLLQEFDFQIQHRLGVLSNTNV